MLISGKLTDYFETGMEGVAWCLQEESGRYYRLGFPTKHLKITSKSSGEILFDGNPLFLVAGLLDMVERDKLKGLDNSGIDLAPYQEIKVPYGPDSVRFLVNRMYFHDLPLAIPLGFWLDVYRDADDYTLEAEFPDDHKNL